jgi:hypothetical protein
MPRTQKIYSYFLFLLSIFIVGAVLIIQPYWGLMDDSTMITQLVPDMAAQGVFAYIKSFTHSDMYSWGMFRPTYPLMAYFLYAPGIAWGPTVTFFLNALLSLGVCYLFCRNLARILSIELTHVLIVLSAFFYQYDLLNYPSLQEKIVLFVGALYISQCARKNSRLIVYYTSLLLLLLLGLASKASFMIFYSMGFWVYIMSRREEIFLHKERREILFAIFLALAGLAMLCFFAYISSLGSYTKQYSVQKILPNLKSSSGVLLILCLLFGICAAIFEARKRRFEWLKLTPIIGLAAFLTIFLPWGIDAYIQTIIGPTVACLLVIALYTFDFVPRRWWIAFFMILGTLICAYRTTTMYSRLHSIGMAAEFVKSTATGTVTEINMPCWEGSDSFRRYIASAAIPPKVIFWKGESMDGRVFAYDQALCPLPGKVDIPAGCTAEILFESPAYRGFRIKKFQCLMR